MHGCSHGLLSPRIRRFEVRVKGAGLKVQGSQVRAESFKPSVGK